MQSKRRTVALLALIVLGIAPFGLSQLISPPLSSHRTLGYYDSDTGAFEPLRTATQDPDAPAVTPTTGTLIFKITINMKTPIPKGAIPSCSAAAAVIETGFSTDDGNLGLATLVSGTTYSCTVTMHYSWPLVSPATDKVILSYKAQLYEGVEITATNGTATTVIGGSGRFSSQTIASIPVPINGATTTENVSVTL